MTRERFIQKKFFKNFGYTLDLNEPKTLNEKINWLKLNYWHPLATTMADKYAVREYIATHIGEEYLVPLLYTSLNPKDITKQNIPNVPCIIKTNHDSSGGIIIANWNAKQDWDAIQSILRANMSQNYYWDGRELPYKHIEPRIVIEQLLVNDSGMLPEDYKVHCFNGKVRMINVDTGRGTANHYRNWYSADWTREPYKWSSDLGNGKFTDPSAQDISKPKLLKDMILLSEKLSKDFPYLRVDWYIFEEKLYFGELTFHHNGGNRPIYPVAWDLQLGTDLNLPSKDSAE